MISIEVNKEPILVVILLNSELTVSPLILQFIEIGVSPREKTTQVSFANDILSLVSAPKLNGMILGGSG
jgi:hypothetical protein